MKIRMSAVSWVGIFIFCAFSLTTSVLRFGYEAEHIAEARMWTGGPDVHPSKGGILEVAFYVPTSFEESQQIPQTQKEENEVREPRKYTIANIFVQPFVTTLLCLVFYGLALKIYKRRQTAILLTLILAFCTMIWPYSKFGMENHLTLWTLAAFLTLLNFIEAPSYRRMIHFAAAAGAIMLTKKSGVLHTNVVGIAALWLMLQYGITRDSRFWRFIGVGFAVGLVFLGLLFYTNLARYGHYMGGGYDASAEISTRYWGENLLAVLISPNKNIFLFSPPILISLWYFSRFWKRFPIVRPMIVSVVLLALWYIFFMAFFIEETWGPRRLHWLVPYLLLPVGIWYESLPTLGGLKKAVTSAVIGLGVLVQIIAVSFDYTAHAFVMRHSRFYTVDNLIWLPEMNAIRFNLHLYRSWMSSTRGDESIDYPLEQRYIFWNMRYPVEPWEFFDVSGYDRIDLWYIYEQNAIYPEPYWFSKSTSWLFLFLLMMLMTSGIRLTRSMERMQSEVDGSETQDKIE